MRVIRDNFLYHLSSSSLEGRREGGREGGRREGEGGSEGEGREGGRREGGQQRWREEGNQEDNTFTLQKENIHLHSVQKCLDKYYIVSDGYSTSL